MTKPWPATCSVCGKPVRKAESHSGAPGSGLAVRHLDCALGVGKGAAVPRSQCSCEHRDSERGVEITAIQDTERTFITKTETGYAITSDTATYQVPVPNPMPPSSGV